MWDWIENTRQQATSSGFRRALERNFLNYMRVREWRELHRQVRLACNDLSFRMNAQAADVASLHQAILPGCLSLIGQHDEKGRYVGARNLKFRIFPGSYVSGRTPRWIMSAEIAETNAIYARTVAGVEPGWIERAALHLIKRAYSEPHFSSKRGEVLAYETVTLYGLTLADRRRVAYSRLDPVVCRKLFILDGLVRGGLATAYDFLTHNHELVLSILELEAKGRRRDLLASEEAQIEFYETCLPNEVMSNASLSRWLRKAHTDAKNALFMNKEALLRRLDVGYAEADYPSALSVGGLNLDLKYRFAPGEPDDGISVRVPVGVLNAVSEEDLEWSVPGMFPALCEQWLKSLPKHTRKHLAPVPDKVVEICPVLLSGARYRKGRVLPAIADAVAQVHGVTIGAGDWEAQRLDQHLLINIQVIDEKGGLLAQGRDLAILRRRFEETVKAKVRSGAGDQFEARELTAFPAEIEIPAEVTIDDGSRSVIAFPAIVDGSSSVSVKLQSSRALAAQVNRSGYPRLAWLQLGSVARYFVKEIKARKTLGLLFASLGDAKTLTDQLMLGIAWYCFFEDQTLPVTKAEFEARLKKHRPDLAQVFERTVEDLESILRLRFDLVRLLDQSTSPAYSDAVADLRTQLDDLIPADLLKNTPSRFLIDIPWYLTGCIYRLEHLQGKIDKDWQAIDMVTNFKQRINAVAGKNTADPEQLQVVRFDLEEVRVALFAEPLTRRGQASVKKLDRKLGEIERRVGLR